MDSACVLVLLLAASDQYASQGMVPDLLDFFLLTTSEEKELAISGSLDVFFGEWNHWTLPFMEYELCGMR